MGFWLFMLFIDLICPFTMIGFGKLFMNRAPQNINSVFGYRTHMSALNLDTWEFAHKYIGKIWYLTGFITLFLSIIVIIAVFGKSNDTVETIGIIVEAVQIILFIAAIFPTEIALRKNFDKNGKRRNTL